MAKVILKNVKKKYEKAEDYSVENFNIEIEQGEFIVLVGPSGCGKSTTLRMIAGLEDISEGEFIIDGEVVNDKSSKDRDIAMVFQSYALYPHMSVAENVAYGLKLRGVDKQEREKSTKDVADYLGLTEYLERKPKDLSGGQRQRVALGRAMVRTPKLYLMDEPLSNLDAKLRTTTRAEITRLHREKGAITIYVTHDQVEAMTMADRIVVMSMGKVQQIGTPEELYKNPKNKFVATFIGQPSMNIISGTFDGERFKNNYMDIRLLEGDCKVLNEKGYAGREIEIGVRAGNIRDDEMLKSTYPDSVVKVKPINIEYLGDHKNIFFELNKGDILTSQVRPTAHAVIDEDYELVIETSKLYFFDKDTEESIKFDRI